MTGTDRKTDELRDLRELLFAAAPDGELAELCRRREAAAGSDLLDELDRHELASLRRLAFEDRRCGNLGEPLRAGRAAELRTAVVTARRTADTDASALFDLVELGAGLQEIGLHDEAATVEREWRRRVPLVARDAALREEARERYAVLAAGEAGENQVAELRASAAALDALGLRRLARPLRNAADDEQLVHRLESLLGRKGVALLERTSLLLLLVVAALLLIEHTFGMPAAWRGPVLWIDGLACLWFISEFLGKLALAPRRTPWFLRHVLTDLLPAIPAALLLLPVGAEDGGDWILVRFLRLLRIAWLARWIVALRPLLQLLRLLLFLIRGLDALVQRFAPILNRDLLWFRDGRRARPAEPPRRRLLFLALRREHLLAAELEPAARRAWLEQRLRTIANRLAPPRERRAVPGRSLPAELPVEELIEWLHALPSEELVLQIGRRDLLALDRAVRVLNAPLVRQLPWIRRLRLPQSYTLPAERVAAFGRRVAAWLEAWRERLLYVADLHGIVTGPQILDRIASAMIAASQRPAVRLILFGGTFLLVRALLGEGSPIGAFLRRFVATPLLVFGAVCLLFLLLGRWLKRIAGLATERLRRTSDAQFLSLLEWRKGRHEETDLRFLLQRTTGDAGDEARAALREQLRHLRAGSPLRDPPSGGPGSSAGETHERIALLYLHYRSGALLHGGDVRTTEQLLASLPLENLRQQLVRPSRRARRRLQHLSLDRGTLLGGPYLWFQFITESVALEAGKRVLDYNRHCIPLAEQRGAPAERLAAMQRWCERREQECAGRTLKAQPLARAGETFATTEFDTLDFVTADAEREQRIAARFGPRVLELLRRDRRAMVREIFGMKPLHRLPRAQRTLNLYRYYRAHLAHGRFLLLPLHLGWQAAVAAGGALLRTIALVREILAPELAARRAESGVAPFAVALRKIHRMRAPGVLEATRLRVHCDAEYCGVEQEGSALERDLDYLQLKARERAELRALASRVRERAAEWRRVSAETPELGEASAPELAAAWVNDQDRVRTLLRAERVLASRREAGGGPAPVRPWYAFRQWLARGGAAHPVDRLAAAGVELAAGERAALRRRWRSDPELRATLDAWLRLPPGTSPRAAALARLRALAARHASLARDLQALRTVQSLTILDLRNYRELVFEIGDYAADGEDPSLAQALP